MSNETKSYLGDAVYVNTDDFGSLVLTTENGILATNTIVIEPEVWSRMVEYVERARKEGRVP